MKTWEVWMEGYATNGNRGTAEYLGSVEAETFQEACDKLAPVKYAAYYDAKRLTVWGCRLFPTGSEAVNSFG